MNLKNLWDWFLIENKIYFTNGECNGDYINLASKKWMDMNYGCHDVFTIDYPWEYDKENIFVVCYAWDEDKLNYFIRIDNQNIALIQNPKMVEKEEFQDVKICLYNDDMTVKSLEKLEYEGKSIKLEAVLQWEESQHNIEEIAQDDNTAQTEETIEKNNLL